MKVCSNFKSFKKAFTKETHEEESAFEEKIQHLKIKRWHYIAMAAIMLMATVLTFVGISNHKFWDDEANTALFARNFIQEGDLNGWDGTNLVGYRQGAELNEELDNVYMPPLQYYVAALSFEIFGETTFGGRALFAIIGILSILIFGLWAAKFTRNIHIGLISAALLALTPTYLMYIRQCRYYVLGVFFTVLLLLAWSIVNGGRRQAIIGYVLGIGATVGLMFTNYLNAAAIFAVLPLFLMFKRYRSKNNCLFLASIYFTALIIGIYIFITRNPFAADIALDDNTPAIKRFFNLFYWHLRGMSTFEFMGFGMMFFLALPWISKKFARYKKQAKTGLILGASILVYIAVTALFSPQYVFLPQHVIGVNGVADMRYVVPLIAIGTLLVSIILNEIYQAHKAAAIIVALLLVFSNIFTLSYLDQRPFTSTLYQYASENFNDYTTGTESIVDYLEELPEGTEVEINPSYMAYPPMFYVPQIHYCSQLSRSKELSSDLSDSLPDYLFVEDTKPDVFIFAGSEPQLMQELLDARFGPGQYRFEVYIENYWRDMSRPELPWHSFEKPATELCEKQGISIFKKSNIP